MYTALIATRFVGDGLSTATAFRPAVADTYALSWEDLVGIPSARLAALAKNVNIIKVTVSDATAALLTSLGADANYRVLWQAHYDDVTGVEDSGNRTAVLTSAQLTNIKAFLQARGYTAGDLAGVTLPITREDAANALIALFRDAT
jgi:uncharacterized Rossmann fold enzyme